MFFFYFVALPVDILADKTIIAWFCWSAFINYQFSLLVHCELFTVVFKIFAHVPRKNRMLVFKIIFMLTCLKLSNENIPSKHSYVTSCVMALWSFANVISFKIKRHFQAKVEHYNQMLLLDEFSWYWALVWTIIERRISMFRAEIETEKYTWISFCFHRAVDTIWP